MRNLFEELDRIKNLMVYEKGTSITEVSASSELGGETPAKTSTEKPSETKGDESKTKEDSTTSGEGKKGEPVLVDKNECFDIKATGRFKVNVPRGSAAVDNFMTEVRKVINSNPKYKDGMDSGTMYIREITLQCFASNYFGGPVEPQYANDYCNTWSVKPDTGQGGVCTDFVFKKYNGKKLPKYTGNQTTNQKLAKNRAVNLYDSIRDALTKEGNKYGIKIDPTTKPVFEEGGSLYTQDNVDEQWPKLISSGKLNPGQIVAVTAKICYTLKELCPDPCMTKDESGRCKCPDGMTYNEETKQCECPPGKNKEGCECTEDKEKKCDDCMERLVKGSDCECIEGLKKGPDGKCYCDKEFKKLPDENCKCPCPKCMEKDENGECKCKEGTFKINDKCYCDAAGKIPVLDDCSCPKCDECTEYNLEKKKCECTGDLVENDKGECVCPTEKPIRIEPSCLCRAEPPPPLKCNYNAERKGGRGVKANNFVSAAVNSAFPVGAGDTLTISFDSLVVPDAFYVKYGDQEFFSGFMGDVWNTEYKQVALSMDERKKMTYIQPKSFIDYINFMKDDDYSVTTNLPRNFVGELIYYKEKEGLVESINAAIGGVGGKLKVDSIFKQGDTEAKKVTDEIKNINIDYKKPENRKDFITQLKGKYNSYSGIMKKNASFTIEKEQKDLTINIIVFSPLDRTIFNMKVECK
jgi:hypothetical protein